MSEPLSNGVKKICQAYGCAPTRLMNIVRAVQAQEGCVGDDALNAIAAELSIPRVEVQSCVSFYSFLTDKPKGRIVIRLCNDIIDRMNGFDNVVEAFCEELGIGLGQTTPDRKITLETTACIGMCDQAPAALVNDAVVTHLSSDKARLIVQELRAHMDPRKLVHRCGDGNNAHPLVRAMVNNNVRQSGPLVLSPVNRGEAIRKALRISPAEVIRAVKTARLRGRGGAGFPTGMKWEFARSAEIERVEKRKSELFPDSRDSARAYDHAAVGERKYIICNADEGEPGTFKDRILLTELPDRVFAGMTIAGYAIGAKKGILYLRGEYAYLVPFLEDVLRRRREDGLLGKDICGKEGINFDIRIQMGAGAYICGEETALISSCEGKRGDPKTRPPFPAQSGYLDFPTVVNNVETLCCVTKILEEGPATFSEYGTTQSTGTKLLSVSGDCMLPGTYELPMGVSLRSVLDLAGAEDAIAVQVGGPSGQLVPPGQFDRKICFDDLTTGGSIMVFGPDRNILQIVHAFMEFFADESCGYCTPCRVGNVLLKEYVERIMQGRGDKSDLQQMEHLAQVIKITSRCGLGQTSPNPVLTSLKNFRPVYEAMVKDDPDGFKRSFDLKATLAESEALTGRPSVHCPA